jgi:hypothetical protein
MATDSVVMGEGVPGEELRHPYIGGAVDSEKKLARSAGKGPAIGTSAPADVEDNCVICIDKPGAFRGKLSSCVSRPNKFRCLLINWQLWRCFATLLAFESFPVSFRPL